MNVLHAMDDTINLARERGMEEVDFEGGAHINFAHLEQMTERARVMDASYGKMCRWLGYIQGVVAASGLGVTLDELKEINKRHAAVPVGR